MTEIFAKFFVGNITILIGYIEMVKFTKHGSKNPVTLLVICFLILTSLLPAENDGKKVNQTGSTPSFTKLNLNNISTYVYSNGLMDNNPQSNSGLTFPKWSNKQAVFQSGFVWGGKVDGQIRVGGSTYLSGLQPGKIISTGVAEDPKLPKNRLYRVRPDYKTAVLAEEIKDEGKSESDIRSQYEKDWNEWPASDGAPFTDVDNDGKYNPEIDIPGVKDAVQTIWFVLNDLDPALTTALYGSDPMGLELQITLWTYNSDFPLNNTYFKKYKLINKSGKTFTDMYVSFCADPDNGNASDDFVGCDSTLNLGFCYNASIPDAVYGNTPPATGYALLQGPLVNGSQNDTAIFDSKKISGKKNLPMTSFYYYVGGTPYYDWPVTGKYDAGTLRYYNLFQGKLWPSGEYHPVPASLGGGVTKFPLSGDPLMHTGYLDGILFSKGDRANGISSGPFEMAPDDTQEVVFAEIAAQSSDNIASVGLLKYFDRELQKKYNIFFNFTPVSAPAAPRLTARYLKDQIRLDWDQNNQAESYDKDGYKFQGYNVYQINPALPDKKYGIRLATFDLADGITSISGEDVDALTGKPVIVLKQTGTDSGIKRTLSVSRDSVDHSSFLIGKKYYFALNAYTYRPDPGGRLTTTESPITVVSVVFQDSLPGLKYLDTLSTNKITGVSNGRIVPVVIDASKVTGHSYQVGFSSSADSITWHLKDLSTDRVILKDQRINSSDNPDPQGPVVDGIKLLVISAPVGMRGWIVTCGSLKWSSKNANVSGYPFRGFNGAIGDGYADWPWLASLGGSTAKADRIPNTLIKFASTDTSGNILNPNDPNASYAYRYLRNATVSAAKPEFAPFIKNKMRSYDYQDYTKTLPFAAFNNETSQRYMVGYLENNIANGKVDGKYWPPSSLNVDAQYGNSSTGSPREWFFIFDALYSEKPDSSLQVNVYYQPTPMLWFGMPTREGNKGFSSNDEFLIIKYDQFTTEDVITFKTSQLTSVDKKELLSSYELKQNYPNPFNPATTIQFSLKERGFTILRVYNILGQVVKELFNNYAEAGLHSISFDATGLASGVYIYRLEVRDKFTEVRKMLLMK